MTFLEHLEYLRWTIIRSLLSILILSFIFFLSKKFIFNKIILGPSYPEFWTYKMLYKIGIFINKPSLCIKKINFTIQSRYMTGQFSIHIISSFIIGIASSFPYIIWEIWKFICPGLNEKEKKKYTK